MSKRLQVILPDEEMMELQKVAQREQLTVGEWVRRSLRQARMNRPQKDAETRLKAVRRAAQHGFPTADIEAMNREIERGHGEEPTGGYQG